jgi:branched-chain amino acid transport system substrate-binding protein
MLTPEATSDSLFEYDYNYIFRMTPNNSVYAETLAEQMRRDNKHSVAIYFGDNEYGRDLAKEMETALTKCDIPVLDRVVAVTAATAGEIALRWEAFGCDAVVVADSLPNMEKAVKNIRDQLPELPIYGVDNFDYSSFREIMGDYAIGTKKVVFDSNKIDQAFWSKFAAAYGHYPDTLALNGYNAVYLLRDAMEETGSTDGTAIAEYLSSLVSHPTLTGNLTYNSDTGEFDGFELHIETIGEGR